MTEIKRKEELKECYSACRELNSLYEAWARSAGLSYNNFLVVYSLWENRDGCTQGNISEQWLLPKQTVSNIVKDLAKRGLADFQLLKSDKRSKVIYLTGDGEEYAERIVSVFMNFESAVLEKLGPKRKKALAENTALYIKYFREKLEESKLMK